MCAVPEDPVDLRALFVKRWPRLVRLADGEILFRRLGARTVTRTPRRTLTVSFDTEAQARAVLKCLHQERVAGGRICVEYARRRRLRMPAEDEDEGVGDRRGGGEGWTKPARVVETATQSTMTTGVDDDEEEEEEEETEAPAASLKSRAPRPLLPERRRLLPPPRALVPPTPLTSKEPPVASVFEATPPAAPPPTLRLPARLTVASAAVTTTTRRTLTSTPTVVESGGFGVVARPSSPPSAAPPSASPSPSPPPLPFDPPLPRLSPGERASLKVFKDYRAGPACSRLYVKNLAKSVTERDLRRLFWQFVEAEDDGVGGGRYFDVRHLTRGRMKGQAFVTFGSVRAASAALDATNGCVLRDRPIVVAFANSAQ